MSTFTRLRCAQPVAIACAIFPAFSAHAEPAAAELPTIDVQNGEAASTNTPGPAPIVQKYKLPQTTESITAKQVQDTVNILDTEDAIKYLPSLFVRKRNNGDTQPVLATRTWGVSSSARSLVYADDILLTALIANNNTIGAPRWGLVAPEEIERVDFLYGPFAAAYPGNSIGGVLVITTRMPEKPEATAKQTEAFQTFNLYKTAKMYRTDQSSGSVGDRVGDFSWFVGANVSNSFAQPLAYVTGTPLLNGAVPALNKLGQVANVYGDSSVLHTQMVNAKVKLAYDFTTWLRGAYTLGYWSNTGSADVKSYLQDAASGLDTFAGQAGFASGHYTILEKHLVNAVSLKSDTRGAFDFDASVSFYNYLQDIQRNPFTVDPTSATPASLGFSTNGRIANLTGTRWANGDLRGIWRPFGIDGNHEVSFGLHGDQYILNNPTYATPTWAAGPDTTGTLYSTGVGRTRTGALWGQDAWRLAPDLRLTLGGRLESWEALDGFNLATTTANTNTATQRAGAITGTRATSQPSVDSAHFSPKASLAWEVNPDWTVKTSFGLSYRFPTVSELYQIVTSGPNLVIPNPNLGPEQDFSEEFSVERHWGDGHVRVSYFQENVNDAIISQNVPNSDPSTPGVSSVTSFTNVDAIRMRGCEIAWLKDNVIIDGMQLYGSVTFLDAKIVSDPSYRNAAGQFQNVAGNWVPNVPDWKFTLAATYRPDPHWSFTLAGRYSGKMYTTLDNADIVSNVYQAFDRFFVVDMRIRYDLDQNASFGFGIDNLNNDKYFLFHPFPQRTFIADARLKF